MSQSHRPASRLRQSLHSWWSDRNLPGVTMKLYAAAKPVVKLMYHRQVMSFIEKNRNVPLSEVTMDRYTRYLAFKYIAAASKAAILTELGSKSVSEVEATTVVTSALFQTELARELLDTPLTAMLTIIATHESTANAVVLLDANICARLVELLSDDDNVVVGHALCTLHRLTQWSASAQAVVKVEPLGSLHELIDAPNPEQRRWTSEILRNLAHHDSTSRYILNDGNCGLLVSWLGENDPDFRIDVNRGDIYNPVTIISRFNNRRSQLAAREVRTKGSIRAGRPSSELRRTV
ncbi:hypothetical protein B0H11DRAFT_2106089 [Mycena galericulata]|nr:hypothetical protein B0H11DRAFT_2106089 [Mycena galericulata]